MLLEWLLRLLRIDMAMFQAVIALVKIIVEMFGTKEALKYVQGININLSKKGTTSRRKALQNMEKCCQV